MNEKEEAAENNYFGTFCFLSKKKQENIEERCAKTFFEKKKRWSEVAKTKQYTKKKRKKQKKRREETKKQKTKNKKKKTHTHTQKTPKQAKSSNNLEK